MRLSIEVSPVKLGSDESFRSHKKASGPVIFEK